MLIILIASKSKNLRLIYRSSYVQIIAQTVGAYWWLGLFFPALITTALDKMQAGVPFVLWRTTDAHSGHWAVMLMIAALGFLTYIHPKPSILRSAFFIVGIDGFHEFLWNIFYLPTCFNGVCSWQVGLYNNGLNLLTQGMVTTLMFMANFAYYYRKEFREIVKYLPYWCGFMLLWETAGFYVTLDARLQAVSSAYYLDPYVNLVEILSWYIFLFPVFTSYLRLHPLRQNALYVRIHYAYNKSKLTHVRNADQEADRNG